MNERAADCAALYAEYHRSIRDRHARALDAEKFAAVLIHAGSPPAVFADDQNYAFRVNAAFKAWAPLTDVPDCFIYFEPGKPPLLLFNSPIDYWYKSAALPQDEWVQHFD